MVGRISDVDTHAPSPRPPLAAMRPPDGTAPVTTGPRELWRTPGGRGFIMLAVMSAALGFAMNAHSNVVTNYFDEVLHLSGPQFGYITAVREVGGFVLIFLTASLYRISLQRVTAGALVVLAVGYALFSLSSDFWTVVPWVLITSFGYHTVLQTQYSLGMSLTTEAKSGAILGKMAAFGQAGTFAALLMIFFIFRFRWLSFRPTFVLLGAGKRLPDGSRSFGDATTATTIC